MVRAGVGGTLIPAPRAEEAAKRGATVRPVSPPIVREVALFHRAGELSAAAQRFVEMARLAADALPEEPTA